LWKSFSILAGFVTTGWLIGDATFRHQEGKVFIFNRQTMSRDLGLCVAPEGSGKTIAGLVVVILVY